MMLTTPVASQKQAFPLAGTLKRLSLSESHTKRDNSPSLPVRRNQLIKLDCPEMEFANSLILAQTCRAEGGEIKGEQCSGSVKPENYSGSAVIQNGCNNENQQVITCSQLSLLVGVKLNQQVKSKEKGGTENTALWGCGFYHHEENQQHPVLDCKTRHDYSNLRNDNANLRNYKNQRLVEWHVRTYGISVGHRVTVGKPVQPFGSMPNNFSHTGRDISFSFLPHGENDEAQDRIKKSATITITTTFSQLFTFSIYHPFGLMPRVINSRRASSFIQFAKLTPSRSASVSNCVLSSGLIRMWNGGDFPAPLGWLSLTVTSFSIDMCTPIDLSLFLLGVHTNMCVPKKTTPPKGITSTRRGLTTNDILSIEATMLNHTPTRFKFLFLAVCRSDLNAKPHRESVTAHSEQDARRSLAGQFVLSFAGRLPEVNHA